ncbi:hypothetical protein [Aliiroseovarius sp. S253]|uniref:hypothetical protein n=1 Tax=Aliiroseovarius sp. S253 TaxID=3415133 RepID=UPI003C7A2E7A
MKPAAIIVFCLCASPATANPITQVPYDQVARTTSGLIDFESFPVLPEPGQVISSTFQTPGALVGSALVGQTLGTKDTFAVLVGQPTSPIRVEPTPPRPPIAIAFHAGFGSNAAFPIGPNGFAQRSGRGEGTLAINFDAPIPSFALRLHLDYDDPLGSRPSPGSVWLHFYGVDATLLHVEHLTPAHGVHSFGFLSTAPISAITLSHQDPGGIAIDDIRYSLDSHTN